MKSMGTIDIEPTWESLCRLAASGGILPEELMPACKIADVVRQAQKAGKKRVEFTFPSKTTIMYQVK